MQIFKIRAKTFGKIHSYCINPIVASITSAINFIKDSPSGKLYDDFLSKKLLSRNNSATFNNTLRISFTLLIVLLLIISLIFEAIVFISIFGTFIIALSTDSIPPVGMFAIFNTPSTIIIIMLASALNVFGRFILANSLIYQNASCRASYLIKD